MTDFPPLDKPAERPTAVYWLYDGRDELLYVGMTNNPVQRFVEHHDTKTWWPRVTTYSIRWFDTRARAEAAESAAILNDGPLQNIEQQPRNKSDGGLPYVPFFIGRQVRGIVARFMGDACPDRTLDECAQLADRLIDEELNEKALIFFQPSSPDERHALDLDALVSTLESFGPLIASQVDAPAQQPAEANGGAR
jgi:hypothetical protein